MNTPIPANPRQTQISLLSSVLILALWIINLALALAVDHSIWWLTVIQIWVQSFLFVGLFIVAHDSMHGLVPERIGRLCTFFYAGFNYDLLKKNHLKHHEIPAKLGDPDYTDQEHEAFFPWVKNFVMNYYGVKEFFIMFFHVAVVLWVGQSVFKLFLFFVLPAWISALQLFYFGTYLPHRNFQDQELGLRARSNRYPVWLSFLSCYHFGYHREHHLYPFLAWWRLPSARALENNKT